MVQIFLGYIMKYLYLWVYCDCGGDAICEGNGSGFGVEREIDR